MWVSSTSLPFILSRKCELRACTGAGGGAGIGLVGLRKLETEVS